MMKSGPFRNCVFLTLSDWSIRNRFDCHPGARSRSKTAQDMSGLSGLGGFFGKTAQTAQILLKKPFKNRSFLAVIFERFFKQDLSGFRAVFERSYKENRLKPTKRPGKVM